MIMSTHASDGAPASLALKSLKAYGEVAPEYYDPERHPTCANFAEIHDGLGDFFRRYAPAKGLLVEVGCGAGRLGRIRPSIDIVLTDISESMLDLARQHAPLEVRCEKMDAFSPHFKNGSVAGIFGFLGDPYNHPEFFRQAARILVPGGLLVFTLPNHRWAASLRHRLGTPLGETTFFIDRLKPVTAPSITREVAEQAQMIAESGFAVRHIESFSLETAPGACPSHHVAIAAEHLNVNPISLPLVDVYVAARSAIVQ